MYLCHSVQQSEMAMAGDNRQMHSRTQYLQLSTAATLTNKYSHRMKGSLLDDEAQVMARNSTAIPLPSQFQRVHPKSTGSGLKYGMSIQGRTSSFYRERRAPRDILVSSSFVLAFHCGALSRYSMRATATLSLIHRLGVCTPAVSVLAPVRP